MHSIAAFDPPNIYMFTERDTGGSASLLINKNKWITFLKIKVANIKTYFSTELGRKAIQDKTIIKK